MIDQAPQVWRVEAHRQDADGTVHKFIGTAFGNTLDDARQFFQRTIQRCPTAAQYDGNAWLFTPECGEVRR